MAIFAIASRSRENLIIACSGSREAPDSQCPRVIIAALGRRTCFRRRHGPKGSQLVTGPCNGHQRAKWSAIGSTGLGMTSPSPPSTQS